MCGICGLFDPATQPRVEVIEQMLALLAHRGPDGSGYLLDHGAVLGHTRLAILDTAGGAQPMPNEDGSMWITFNGEIFNYVELGEELRGLGHRIRTTCDTEVILHAWEQWGPACLDRFNGQWAFAIWDRRRRQIVISRDRLGVRPLYYIRSGGRFLFASEIKALFADPAVPREIDPVGLAQTLSLWSPIAPTTTFAGVSQLPPGHYAVIDESGMREYRYWTPDFPSAGAEPEQDLAKNTAGLRDQLVDATRLRFLRSDVPVGAYLSGGLDSAITASVIRHYTNAPLHTFSLRFWDEDFDEGRYQQEMADRLGTIHHEVRVDATDIAAVFPDVVAHAEAPLLRAAPAPLFLLSKLVRASGFKVVVTGEGADEVLAGYDIFREARVRQFWARDPDSAKRERAAELLYPWMARSPSAAPAFARSFFARNLDPGDPALSHRPRWDSTLVVRDLLSPDVAATLPAAGTVSEQLVSQMPAQARNWDPLARAQWLEMKTLLAGYILASQGDRMLMANSIEGRFPFLDPRVVDLCAGMPARHKLFGLSEKYVLKRAFADLVPEDIRLRPKQPYRAPDAASFFPGGRAVEWLSDVAGPDALRSAGIFKPAPVAGLLAKAARSADRQMSNTDNMRILAVVSTQVLHERFIVNGFRHPTNRPPQPMISIDLTRQQAGA